MTVVHQEAVVAYSCNQMYQLVDNVTAYDQFIPWCVKSTELVRDATIVHGQLTFVRTPFRQSLTTANHLRPGRMIILELIEGPFKYLTGFWRFQGLDNSRSRVTLHLEFECAHLLLDRVMTPFFTQMTQQLVAAFIAQADRVYLSPEQLA